MDKLEKILDDYSTELKYNDLYNLFKCLQTNDSHVNELMKRAYNQALEDVKQNVKIKFHDGHFKEDKLLTHIQSGQDNITVSHESIDKLKIK